MEKILTDAAKKISGNNCYSPAIQSDFNLSTFAGKLSSVADSLLEEIRKLLTHITKKRNIQKFYSTYFSKIVLKNTEFMPGIPSSSSTLFLSKVADLVVGHCKSFDLVPSQDESVSTRDNEIYGLQYIGGYVLHKLYNKLMSAKNRDPELISVMISCKGSAEAYQDAKLINAVNRGGLWCPSENSTKIFKIVELRFRYLLRKFHKTIDTDKFVQEMQNDLDIWTIFREILQDCDIKISKESKENSLRKILLLFVKVRIHSFARQKTEEAREKARENSKKALRKELKRKESEPSNSKAIDN